MQVDPTFCDVLVGVVNNSGGPVSSITLSSSTDIFGFDDDGACTQSPGPSNCSADSSGYGGPGVFFANISGDQTTGDVVFTPALANGETAWFALEGDRQVNEIGVPVEVVPTPLST